MRSNSRRLTAGLLFMAVTVGGLSLSVSRAESQTSRVYTGEMAEDMFGRSVSSAGDINKDGFADLLIGAWRNDVSANDAGRAYIYSGQTGSLLYTFEGEADRNFFGYSARAAGDVNNDGYDDVIIGAYFNSSGATHGGKVYVFSGKEGDTLHTFTGTVDSDWFGLQVSGAGDVDNDGFADLIIGADETSLLGGRACVYSGQTGALLYTFPGESANDRHGRAVSGAGDVNQDGFADVIVGAPFNDAAGIDAGRAYVYSGQSGDVLFTFTGEVTFDNFGWSVSGAGDVNLDGFPDLIVGAPSNDAGGDFAGRAFVFSGQNGALLYTFTGEAVDDVFGTAVASAGDVNADGFADLIIGASGKSFTTETSGKVYVYSGRTGELLYRFVGEEVGDQFGISVASAGDVDNDGQDELIIGASLNDGGGFRAGRAYVLLLGPSCCVTAGDANHDGAFDIADITFDIARIFSGGPGPFCQDEADVNGDNSLNISDVTHAIARIFHGGAAPACGVNGS